jgi:hypothetical protein
VDDALLPDRSADLERRVEALERGVTRGGAPDGPGESGVVRYSGDVQLHSDVAWEIALDARTALGQLYHHPRSLTHCGLVEQDGRGSYRIASAVVRILVLLTAAADVAGQLR